ncbi:GNAT family N-acetyltransferase [Aequorivita viscosa]|uniref:Acetyltransferase (GNAT) domain-containing protein n=1 Tax=Aequorivita viscosa TaxID=797419 RepID=A0A1M6JWY8_9FLAO|nr:GNAT family N-acetyltransferase [Aequorivita viscosa]SDX17934.1 Acetyltransferase (GNAT) domain-containing protein [Aequorivita viscosa]SHJ51199.1 Acetyltransferase (GNAT) domain-containing protein [Aequorivita viscosa]
MKELTESLNTKHRKNEFSCGKDMLDNYLQRQANQDIKRKLSVCFVLNDNETDLLKGYYTLANNSIAQELIPAEFQKKLPNSYKSIPTTLLGRLAIDKRFQRQGVGKLLLVDALRRSYDISKSIGSFAVVVDPIDEDAEKFYYKFGFIKLPDSGKMFLPMNTIRTLFE